MLKFLGILLISFFALVGIYTLVTSDKKDVDKAKQKMGRVYDAVKKELQK